MNEKREDRQKKPAAEPPREKDRRQTGSAREQEPLDEQSLDEVLRDCPL